MEDIALNPFVIEFQRLQREGWEPDREEFLSRVPDEERDEVAAAIDALPAGPEPETAPESEPEVPPTLRTGTDQFSLEPATDAQAELEPEAEPQLEPEAQAAAPDIEQFVKGFESLIGEGWDPDPEEFLRRVPENVRADVAGAIDDIIKAARDEATPTIQPLDPTDAARMLNELFARSAASEPEPDLEVEPEAEAEPALELELESGPGPEPETDPEPEPDPEPAREVYPEALVEEFLRLVDDGYEPDRHEYLGRLPEEHRDQVARMIEEVMDMRGELNAHGDDLAAEPADEEIPVEPAVDDGAPPEIPGFRIDRKLGSGALGTVYSAMDESLQRRVALKILHRGTPGALEEARRAAALQHPAIVTIHSVADGGDRPAIVMEHIDGQPLDKASEPLGYKQKATLLLSVAHAIAAAHDAGIIHRDLKPENILVTQELEPKVLDFGLALSASEKGPAEGVFEGSPLYASPEQAAGKKLTPASDVFSFGSVMYKVLSAEVPYTGTISKNILEKIKTTNPPYPRDVNPGVPQDLQSICLACMARNPRARPTARQVAQDLARYLAGETARLRPAMYRNTVQKRLSDQVTELTNWERQGIISQPELDKATALYRRMQADEDHWIFDDRRISRPQTVLYATTWMAVVACALMVWQGWDDLAPWMRVAVPGVAWALMVGIGLLAYARRETVAAGAFLAGATMATLSAAAAVFHQVGVLSTPAQGVAQFLPDGPFTNSQLLAASGAALALSLAGLWMTRLTAFAWTTAGLVVTSYVAFLTTQNYLDWARVEQALWILPLAGLMMPALVFERSRRYRWAPPFHMIALTAFVGALDVMAINGDVFGLIGVEQLPSMLSMDYAALAANGLIFFLLMIGLEASNSLDLRRSARWLQVIVPLHLLGALFVNALDVQGWSSVTVYLAAVLFMLGMAPWRSRRWLLTGGLGGIALGCYLPIELDLVSVVPYTMSIAFIGLAGACLTFLRIRKRA